MDGIHSNLNQFGFFKIGVLPFLLLLFASPTAVYAQTTVEYIHTDALGSPVAVTDASGNVIEREVYEPYGSPIARPPSDQPGFTGHVADSLTSLTYMQQRYYDPQIGRFLSVDPVTAYSNPAGAFNRYWYANNNPYRFTDPDGRYSCSRDGGQCKVADAKLAESFVAAAGTAHEKMKEGSAKALLGGILNMIGSPNDGNGFVINFASLEEGTLGQMSSDGMNLDLRQIKNSAMGLGLSERVMGGFVVAHEGSHKWDSMQPGARRSYFPATGLERMVTEINAYGLESAMGNALGINNQLNVPGMSLKDRRKAIWEGARSSWEGACTKGGPTCSGYEP